MASAKENYFYGLGRRKAATARARLFVNGKGTITVNDKSAESYFDGSEAYLSELLQPLMVIGKEKQFNVSLLVSGGGMSGQIDACKLAIAKAISIMDEDLRGSLKKASLLKRDPREKERKKYGLRSARKREQFSKR